MMEAKGELPRVEGYHGWVRVDGVTYSKDIVIHASGEVTERDMQLSLPYRKDYFHTPLSEYELDFLSEEDPQVVIIGSGFKGMMLLTPKAKQILEDYDHLDLLTDKAIEAINSETRRFVAILHVSC